MAINGIRQPLIRFSILASILVLLLRASRAEIVQKGAISVSAPKKSHFGFGKECVFPFITNGKQYTKCTTDNTPGPGTRSWCATKVDANNTMMEWRFCMKHEMSCYDCGFGRQICCKFDDGDEACRYEKDCPTYKEPLNIAPECKGKVCGDNCCLGWYSPGICGRWGACNQRGTEVYCSEPPYPTPPGCKIGEPFGSLKPRIKQMNCVKHRPECCDDMRGPCAHHGCALPICKDEGRSYTPTFNASCFAHFPNDATGPYATYDDAKAACDSLPPCKMFYKKHDEPYYTCPTDSRVDTWPGITLFTSDPMETKPQTKHCSKIRCPYGYTCINGECVKGDPYASGCLPKGTRCWSTSAMACCEGTICRKTGILGNYSGNLRRRYECMDKEALDIVPECKGKVCGDSCASFSTNWAVCKQRRNRVICSDRPDALGCKYGEPFVSRNLTQTIPEPKRCPGSGVLCPPPKFCCYGGCIWPGDICKGRPFVVEGSARTVISKACDDSDAEYAKSWHTGLTPSSLENGTINHEVGRRWVDQAEGEHASVASFARNTLQLLTLGSPSDLLVASQQAAIDEVNHAKISYDIASVITGLNLAPGPLDVQESMKKLDLMSVTRSIIHEGCVGETLAAVEARVRGHATEEQYIKKSLLQIAEEETNHAQLAWDTIEWIAGRNPDLLSFAENILQDELERQMIKKQTFSAQSEELACENPYEDDSLQKYGFFTREKAEKVTEAGIRGIILPAHQNGFVDVGLLSKNMKNLDLSQF